MAPEVAEANETRAPVAVETFDATAPDTAPDAAPTPDAASEAAEAFDTPAPEIVETAEVLASETMVETAKAAEPPASLVAPAPSASADLEFSVATGDSLLALTAPVNHTNATPARRAST